MRRWSLILALVFLAAAPLRALEAQEAPESVRYQPASRGVRPAVDRWRDLVAEQEDWDVEQALDVIACESAGDPAARNPSGATGLFQLLGWRWLAERLFGTRDLTEPRVNVALAHVLWADSGGTFRYHWYASRGCWL